MNLLCDSEMWYSVSVAVTFVTDGVAAGAGPLGATAGLGPAVIGAGVLGALPVGAGVFGAALVGPAVVGPALVGPVVLGAVEAGTGETGTGVLGAAVDCVANALCPAPLPHPAAKSAAPPTAVNDLVILASRLAPIAVGDGLDTELLPSGTRTLDMATSWGPPSFVVG
jgi:hypothetical protein